MNRVSEIVPAVLGHIIVVSSFKRGPMKSKATAYLLWLLSFFGWLGFHRFYLKKYGTGLLWIFTFGLGGLGALIDLFTLGGAVDQFNTNVELAQIRASALAKVNAAVVLLFAVVLGSTAAQAQEVVRQIGTISTDGVTVDFSATSERARIIAVEGIETVYCRAESQPALEWADSASYTVTRLMAPSNDPRDVVKVQSPDIEAPCTLTLTREVKKSGSTYTVYFASTSGVNSILIHMSKAQALDFVAKMRDAARSVVALAQNPR